MPPDRHSRRRPSESRSRRRARSDTSSDEEAPTPAPGLIKTHLVPNGALAPRAHSQRFLADVPCDAVQRYHPLVRKVLALLRARLHELTGDRKAYVQRAIDILKGKRLFGYPLALVRGYLPGDDIDARCSRCFERSCPCLALAILDEKSRLQIVDACILCTLSADSCSLRGPAPVRYQTSFNSEGDRVRNVQAAVEKYEAMASLQRAVPEMSVLFESALNAAAQEVQNLAARPVSKSRKRHSLAARQDKKWLKAQAEREEARALVGDGDEAGPSSKLDRILNAVKTREPQNWKKRAPEGLRTSYYWDQHFPSDTPPTWDRAGRQKVLLEARGKPMHELELLSVTGSAPSMGRTETRAVRGRWPVQDMIDRAGNINRLEADNPKLFCEADQIPAASYQEQTVIVRSEELVAELKRLDSQGQLAFGAAWRWLQRRTGPNQTEETVITHLGMLKSYIPEKDASLPHRFCEDWFP